MTQATALTLPLDAFVAGLGDGCHPERSAPQARVAKDLLFEQQVLPGGIPAIDQTSLPRPRRPGVPFRRSDSETLGTPITA
jgi:hypothetical protein